MFRKTLVTTAVVALSASVAFAALTADDRTRLLEEAASLQGNRDGTLRGTTSAGEPRIAAVDFGRGPVVYQAGDPIGTADDVLWCSEDARGRLESCTPWLDDETGCVFGICWCSGGCDGYVNMICPEPYYASSCWDKEGGGQLCVCTEND